MHVGCWFRVRRDGDREDVLGRSGRGTSAEEGERRGEGIDLERRTNGRGFTPLGFRVAAS